MVARLRSGFSDRRLAVTASLGVLSLFVIAMIGFRIAYTGSREHIAIAWNLFLAWIPFAIALFVYDRARRGISRPALGVGAALWLLFLPNAPYIVTDLKYIGRGGGVPELYDLLLLTGAAWAGLLLGLMSLLLMHAVAQRIVGAITAWCCVVAVLALSSFGIYLGRVQRWNSWDVFVRPGSLAAEIAGAAVDPFSHPKPIAVMILFTFFLTACYLVFYSFARLSSLLSD
jgi:uncharacterized membrane protein